MITKIDQPLQKSKAIRFRVSEEVQLMLFLVGKMPEKSRSNIKSLLANKQVIVDGLPVTQYNQLLQAEQQVEIRTQKMGGKQVKYRGLTVIYEDLHLIVIEKSEGLLSIATDKKKDLNAYSILSDHVKKQDPKNRIFVVHRLDRDTSGLMMFAKSEKIQALLQESWGPTTKERHYLAVTEGVVRVPSGTVESYLQETKALIVFSTPDDRHGGQLAVTHYETLKTSRWHSLLKVSLETGRKNQVRVHCKDLGHPLIGDDKYGAQTNPIRRLGLHAWVLAFNHPISGEPLRFETSIPEKFLRLFEKKKTTIEPQTK